jgi:hypothetical protein
VSQRILLRCDINDKFGCFGYYAFQQFFDTTERMRDAPIATQLTRSAFLATV